MTVTFGEKMDGSSCTGDSMIQNSPDPTESEQSMRKICLNFKHGVNRVIQTSPRQGLKQTPEFVSLNPFTPALNSTSHTIFSTGANDAIWMNISFDSREQLVGRRAVERINRCASPQIQQLIILYAQKAVSAERQLAQYIDEYDSLQRRLEVAEKTLLEYHSVDNGPKLPTLPMVSQARASCSEVELGIEPPAERILSLLSSILFFPAAEVAPAEHAEVQTCREQILLCMKKLREYPLVQKEMFASLHNWSRENMEIDILALMETLQKACRNVTESLDNEDGDPQGMHNPTTIIKTLVRMCEIMKSLIARFGHLPYEKKRSGVLKSSLRSGPIPSVSSVRCSSAASRRFGTTAGAQAKEMQSLIDRYALKATSVEIKLAESVDECLSLRKEMAKSSHERDSLRSGAAQSADECISLRKESKNLRIELEKSVDECESLRREVAELRRELAQSVDECESLRKEAARSVDECASLRTEVAECLDEWGSRLTEAAESANECISLRTESENLRRELAVSVEECESLRKEAARSVDECTSLRSQVANLRRSLQAGAEVAERAPQTYNSVDSGLCNLEEPTLALVQSCLSNVETAIRQCADEMIELHEVGGSVTCNLHSVLRKARREKELGESRRLLYDSIAWQAVLCECMFRAFGNPSFTVKHTGLFKELVPKKKSRFRYYMSVKDMDPDDLYSQDKSFFEFVHHQKEHLKTILVQHLKLRAAFGLNYIALDKIPSTFVKLGHSVWCLHKVAFAFESLGMFLALKDSVFREDHMLEPDDICPQESLPERAPRTVALVILPGFRLGVSIIKAKVCCVESLTS